MQQLAQDNLTVPHPPQNKIFHPGFLALFLILLGLYCFWVLSLPVFPTQDDAQHLYYVNVMHHLLSGKSVFSNFYSVRFPLPPYTGQYLFLYLLTSLFNPVLAEKVMVCLMLVFTALGFRFFASAIGRDADVVSLWMIPLSLSWPLFMGFHSFCLSLSFSLWALGFWFRAIRTRRVLLWAAFFVAVLLTLFTHPVPLLIALAVIGGDVVFRFVQAKLQTKATYLQALSPFKGDMTMAALACSSLLYITLFLNKSKYLKPYDRPLSELQKVSSLIRLQWMCFASGGLATKFFRCVLYGLLLFSFVLAYRGIRQRWKDRTLGSADYLLICSLGFAAALPFMPSGVNGLNYFVARLPIFLWVLVMAAASGSMLMSPKMRALCGWSACLFALFSLGVADRLVRPLAQDVAVIENSPVPTNGRFGLLFDAPFRLQDKRVNFASHFRWAGARFFRHADAIMINDPWGTPPNILPITHLPNAANARFQYYDIEHPDVLHAHLMRSAPDRDAILSSANFILFVGQPQKGTAFLDPLLALDSSRHWGCTIESWYFVCEPNRNGNVYGKQTDPELVKSNLFPVVDKEKVLE